MIMGLVSDMVKVSYDFVDDFIFWRDPDKAIMLIKEALKLPLLILIGLYFMPIRIFVILGIWVATLANSEFFVTLGRVIVTKVYEMIYPYTNKELRGLILHKLYQLITL